MMTAGECYEFTMLMLCVWREARNQPYEGLVAVAWTIRNRKEKGGWFGNGYSGVILKPWQFSSFNPNDPNASKLPLPETDPAYGSCVLAAKHVYEGTIQDPTFGATHYYVADMPNPPKWAESMKKTVQIGAHVFFKENS